MQLIEVVKLNKYFYSEFKRIPFQALKNVSFQVEKGTSVGMLGANGAGKTTIMKIILGLLKPSSGEVKILGKSTSNAEILSKIGYMPESPYFYSYLNGYELLNLCADLLGMDKKVKKDRIEELLELLGMSSRAYTRLGKCSKGMLQRIGIAQSLLNDPDLVMLDEPMSGLDPLGRNDIKNVIMSLKEKNKTIFFNSHILSDVQDICDRVIVIKMGRLIAQESVHTIIESPQYSTLEDFFVQTIQNTFLDEDPKLSMKEQNDTEESILVKRT